MPCGGSASRFNLVTDPVIGTQVFDLTFLPSDIAAGRHYTTIQTVDDSTSPPNPCCVMGELFPSNYYMEATYRIQNTPAVANQHIGGLWWAFWQGGQGLSPFTSPHATVEVDHPEQHGEWPELLDWAMLNWYTGSGGGYFPPSDIYAGLDATAYHTYGVRSTADGSGSIALCSYVDGVQRSCNTFSLASGQSAERKYPILFVGYQCYYFPSVSSNCINIPISSIYSCNGGNFCVHAASTVTEQNFWPVQMNISGVTGASNINGSWPATAVSWLNGATDWILTGSTFNGAPTGGTINATSQVNLLIQSVRVWSCANWAGDPCYTTVLNGSP